MARALAQRQWAVLIGALVAADLVAGLTAFQLAALLVRQPGLGSHISAQYWQLILLMLPLQLALFWTQGLYDRRLLLRGTREYAGVVRGAAGGLLALVLLTFAVRLRISREWTVLSWLLVAALVGALRFAVRRLAHLLGRKGWFISNAIIVGAAVQSVAVARQLNLPGSGMRVVGVLDDYQAVGRTIGDGLRVLGKLSAWSLAPADAPEPDGGGHQRRRWAASAPLGRLLRPPHHRRSPLRAQPGAAADPAASSADTR